MARYKGKKRRRRRALKNIQIDELSGVDTPAQEHAQVVLMKREEEHAMTKGAWLTSSVEGHAHLILNTTEQAGQTTWTQSEGEEQGHSHPWVMQDGEFLIGEADGHTHEVVRSQGIEMRAPEQGDDMGKETDEAADRIKALETELAVVKAHASLTEAERSYYGTLNGEDAEAFLKCTPVERGQQVAKANATDPVVYTSPITGKEYKKSFSSEMLEIVKQADEDRAELARMTKRAELGELRKRAEELDHLKGDLEVRAALIKAIDGIDDVKTREAAHELLKSHNESFAPAFSSYGIGKTNGNEETAEVQLETLAKKRAADDKVPYLDAYEAVTKENPELYYKALRGN